MRPRSAGSVHRRIQLRDHQARLGQPSPHKASLSEFTKLRDQLKTRLSATRHESGEDRGPTASELADRINALKSANTIEATPQRVQRKQAAAEEPITARIRRRQEAHPASGQTGEHDVAAAIASEVQSVEQKNSPGTPPMTFQERIARERQQQGEGEGQSTG